ncbi:hypothetical protein ACLOJK_003081 [Asimina triloba]
MLTSTGTMDALKSASSFTDVAAAASTLTRSHLRSRHFAPSAISFLRPSSPPAAAASQKLRSGISALVHVETFGSQPEAERDDPIFGLWNPSDAIPLNWSEGHVWSIELDLPVARTIQYKFILRCNNGEIKWQPGPDRILKTWETKNTVVISEDWRFVSLQKIMELEAETGEKPREKNRSVFQEVEAGSNSMALSSDQLLEMNDGEVLITRGDAFPKEIPTIMMADACIGEGDEDPPVVSV